MKNHNYSLFAAGILTLFFFGSHPLTAQVSIDGDIPPEELVTDYLIGSGVNVSNITFNGQPADLLNNQIGLYSGISSFVEFNEGIAMATAGVNVFTGLPSAFPTNPYYNDSDLYQIANSAGTANQVYDCAILEFDFVPDFEYLTVGYVFASYEYPSYTCSAFNDVFGFFLSGPGISGSYTNNAINIAVIPGTETPVGINTINSGSPSGPISPDNCLAANPNFVQDSIYFVSNPSSGIDEIQFPGMTVNLYANYVLQVGETYHIKLAISDVSDTGLNSGVLLEGASFSAFPLSSVEDISPEDVQLKVYPNPTADYVTVEVGTGESREFSMRILDVSGKEVVSATETFVVSGSSTQQVDVSSLTAGSYFVELMEVQSGERHITHLQKRE